MAKQIALSVTFAFLGGILVFLMFQDEAPADLAVPGIHVEHSRQNIAVLPRRSLTESRVTSLKFAHLEQSVRQLKQEAEAKGTELRQAQKLIAGLKEKLARDDDIPIFEPELGLTARQEFRLTRLIHMSKDKAILKHRKSANAANSPRSLRDEKELMMSMKERARLLSRNLKKAKKDVLIRELGEERASSLAIAALERRNIYAASAKTEQQRRTMRSIFNRNNKLAAMLIDAFSANHH